MTFRGTTRRKATLETGSNAVKSTFDAKHRTGDAANDNCAKNDEQRPVLANRAFKRGVTNRGAVERADDKGDQSESVGHSYPCVISKPIANDYADGGARQHCDDIEYRAGSDHTCTVPTRRAILLLVTLI